MAVGAGHALAVGFDGTVIPDDVIALAEQSGLGGVILFARNCPSLETVLSLTAAARRLGSDVLVMVDHEGGRVHRLPAPFTRFPPAAAVARASGA
jgi:beta-N-acetylhexosaminidase